MKTTFVWLLVTVIALPQSASACLFPLFPTYSAGFGYRAPVQSFAPVNNGCGQACGFVGSSCCGAPAGCCGAGGCNTGFCGGGTCSNCVGQPVSSNRPVPDEISDEADPRDETFDEDYQPPRPPIDDIEPEDTFEKPNPGTGFDPDRDTTDQDWRPPRGSFGEDRGGSDFAPLDSMPDFDAPDLDPSRDLREFGADGAFKPSIDESPETPAVEDHSAQKPPMNHPVDETSTNGAKETTPADFLSPEDESTDSATDKTSHRQFLRLSHHEFRSRHTDVNSPSPFRLAGESRRSGAKKQVARRNTMHWISLPMPEGRVRL